MGRVVEALGARDYGRAASELHPDAVWNNTDAFPGPRRCSGVSEITAFWATLFDTFDRAGMEIEDATESDDTVVVHIHSWGTGEASGAPVDIRWAGVCRLRDGKIVRVDVHGHYDKARRAAGLSD